MDVLHSFLTTIGGAIVGGTLGYLFSNLQWRQAIKREDRLRRQEEFKALIALTYEVIEYIRDYWANSQHMRVQEFMACMTGRDPITRILAVVVASAPELRSDAERLKAAVGNVKGPGFPVTRGNYEAAINVANEFGAATYEYVKKHC